MNLLLCHIYSELVFVKMFYCLLDEMHKKNCMIRFYLLKGKNINNPIENILLKHNTEVILCFSKNTSVVQICYIRIYYMTKNNVTLLNS